MGEDEGEDSGRGIWGGAVGLVERNHSPPKDQEISEPEVALEKLRSERNKSLKVTEPRLEPESPNAPLMGLHLII